MASDFVQSPSIDVLPQTISELLALKYGPPGKWGWGPSMRAKFGYLSPDDWYEAYVFERVTAESDWLDVGCGRNLFPSNVNAARILSTRCHELVGLDPSDNIDDNPFVHNRAKCQIEDFKTDQRFDLVTLRMVAEHIQNPEAVVRVLAGLTKPGGRVVIYTVSKWAPVSMIAAMTPMWIHHLVKRWLWRTQERDTFPVAYKMNTRGALQKLFSGTGLNEEEFRYLDDCRSLQRWPFTNYLELSLFSLLRRLGLNYPECCIFAVYRRSS